MCEDNYLSLSLSTSTDVAQRALGVLSIEADTDKKKATVRQSTLYMDRQFTGIVSDAYLLLKKIVSKWVWNTIINKRIYGYFISCCNYNRLLPVMSMHYINSIFNGVGPCNVWSLYRSTPSCTHHCRSAINILDILLSQYQGGTCQICNHFVKNLYMHLLFMFTENENARNSLWRVLQVNIMDSKVSVSDYVSLGN